MVQKLMVALYPSSTRLRKERRCYNRGLRGQERCGAMSLEVLVRSFSEFDLAKFLPDLGSQIYKLLVCLLGLQANSYLVKPQPASGSNHFNCHVAFSIDF